MRKKEENEISVNLYGDWDTEHRPNMSEAKRRQMVRITKEKVAFDNIFTPK